MSQKGFCLWVVPSSDGKVRKVHLTMGRAFFAFVVLGVLLGTFVYVTSDYVRVQMIRAKNYVSLKIAEHEKQRLTATNHSLQAQLKDFKATQARVVAYERDLKNRVDELTAVLQTSSELGLVDKNFFEIQGEIQANVEPELDMNAPLIDDSHFGESDIEDQRLAGFAEKPKVVKSVVGQPKLNAPSLVEVDPRVQGLGGAELDCKQGACEGSLAKMSSGLNESSKGAGLARVNWAHSNADPITNLVNRNINQNIKPFAASNSLIERMDSYIELVRKMPIALPAKGRINSGFGYRFSPFTRDLRLHQGIDIALPHGASINSSGEGIVKTVRRCPTYGLMVDIQHAKNVVTRYAHLSKIFVSEGEKVCRGEVIGLAGSTGRSTGPHLHFEIRVNGKAKNPKKFFELGEKLAKLDLRAAADNPALRNSAKSAVFSKKG